MSTVVAFNGSSFTVPATGEEDWGGTTKVDGLLVSLAGNALAKSGGTFALTAEVDFGSTAGLKALSYKSRGSNVGTTGILRLANAESIVWRNAANNADLPFSVNSSDQLTYNSVVLFSSSGVLAVPAGGTGIASYTAGDLLYASGATTLSKLALGSANTVLASDGSSPPVYRTIVNADINASAAIARSKIASGTADHVLINSGAGALSSEATLATTRGGTNIGTYTTGDILYASASNVLSKLAAGTAGQVLKQGVSVLAWGSPASTLAVVAKTGTYTILNTDDAITGDSDGGAFTLTLPDCATNSGKVFKVKKIGTAFATANALTVTKAGSDTIFDTVSGGTTTLLHTPGEEIEIVSFGSTVWQVLSRRIPTKTVAYTPTYSAGFDTVTGNATFWRRIGDCLHVFGYGVTGTVTGGTLSITLPAGLSIDTAKIVSGTRKARVGLFQALVTSASPADNDQRVVIYDGSDATLVWLTASNQSNVFNLLAGTTAFSNGDSISFDFVVPISGWNS